MAAVELSPEDDRERIVDDFYAEDDGSGYSQRAQTAYSRPAIRPRRVGLDSGWLLSNR
jgi:hypothetical protein